MDRNALNSIPLGAGAPNNLVRSKISQTFQQVSGMSGFVEYAIEIEGNKTQEDAVTFVRETRNYVTTNHQQDGHVFGRQQLPVSGCVATAHELSSNGRSNRLRTSRIDQEHLETLVGIPHVYHSEFGGISQEHLQATALLGTQLTAIHSYVLDSSYSNGELISSRHTAIHGTVEQERIQAGEFISSAHTAIHVALSNVLQLTDFVVAYDYTQEWAPFPRRVALGKQSRSIAVSSLDTSSGVR